MKLKIIMPAALPLLLLLLLVFACKSASGVLTSQKTASVLTHPQGMDREAYLEIIDQKLPQENAGVPGNYPPGSPVAKYGKLQVIGTQLCDEKGNPVQLCGLFLRALMVESKFINRDAFNWLAREWRIDMIRIPFMSEKWYSEPSYINKANYEQKIHDAVRLSEEVGMYCVIDWHVLGDGNPFKHAAEAREFFQKLAYTYGAKKHVIYEICNEPNGNGVTWDAVIKPYAEFILPVIRAGDPDAVIIVGTGTWSQDVQDAAAAPLEDKNILYAFHFYAGTHKQALRDRIRAASFKIALFSSEWGNSDCYARGGPYIDESKKWLEFMSSRKISWCHYALTDFEEGAAMLKPFTGSKGGWKDGSLTPSGRFIVNYLKNR